MKYKKILRQIALKENISVKEVQAEMQAAINAAGLNCSIEEFINKAVAMVKEKTIYSNIV